MDFTWSRLSWWKFWRGEDKEPVSNESSLNSSTDWGLGLKEVDDVKFSSVKGAQVASSTRKGKPQWQSGEQRSIDSDHDVVLVPRDGFVSESDDSDWSIGWLEPLAPDFQGDEEGEDSFAVLVRCYSNVCMELEGPNSQLLGAIRNPPNVYDVQYHVEQWRRSTYCDIAKKSREER
ncbi:hypothetical protein NMG60_11007479 [Bertholletia excelsa]